MSKLFMRSATRVFILVLFLSGIGTAINPSLQAQPMPVATDADYFDGGKVAQIVARIMEQFHVAQKPFDETINKIFLKNYYDALDPAHMIFLQSDIDEFNAKYEGTINNLTKSGDITPATEIHDRFMSRLAAWEIQIQELLKQKMDFTMDDNFLVDRRKVPWPKDQAEGKDLWRERIKYEVLESRLATYENTKLEQEKKANIPSKALSTKISDVLSSLTKGHTPSDESGAKQSDTKGGDEAKKHPPEDILVTLSKNYARNLKEFQEEEPIDVVTRYLSSLTFAFDPHSEYQPPEEAKNFEISTINLSLTGIGAVLRSKDGYAQIVSLVPGGPADLNNQLKPNDRVVAVKQEKGEVVNVVDMRLNKVVDLIRGARGTKVTLTVIPADTVDSTLSKNITIVRDEVHLEDQRAKAKIFERELPNGGKERLGLLTLEPGFYDNQKESYSAASDTAKLIKRMEQENVTGVIIDLRRNGGGLLDQAIQFTSLFIKDGPVVQVKDAKGRIQVQPFVIVDSKQIYSGPLVVMTSRLSASAAEIVAAALQDYGRAIVVGDKTTHGKGTVQTLVRLKEMMGFGTDWDPGQLKITVQKFYRIGGNSTQLLGVVPDVVLPSMFDYEDGFGETSLPNALPGDEIPAAQFTKIGATNTVVPYLLSRSTERVRQDKDFGYLMEAIEIQKKRNLDKDISLNEVKRRIEIDQFDSRREVIKKEREQREPSKDKVYSLDVTMVDAKQPLKQISGPGMSAAEIAEVKKSSSKTGGDEDEEESSPADNIDMHLMETLNILHDYIKAFSKVPDSIAAHLGQALRISFLVLISSPVFNN